MDRMLFILQHSNYSKTNIDRRDSRITMVSSSALFVAVLALFQSAFFVSAFTCRPNKAAPARSASTFARQGGGWSAGERVTASRTIPRTLFMSDKDTQTLDDGVVELVDEVEEVKASVDESEAPQVISPFLSQGEILPEALNPDLSDPKQARVIIYIIISLLPVLFLVPLMLGSRDLVPLDMLPPIDL
jgi:hypothetical protein